MNVAGILCICFAFVWLFRACVSQLSNLGVSVSQVCVDFSGISWLCVGVLSDVCHEGHPDFRNNNNVTL